MKQTRTFFAAVGMLILLAVPMTAFAASEEEAITWTGSIDGQLADAGPGEVSGNTIYESETGVQQETEASQETEAQQEGEADQGANSKQEEEPEKEEAKIFAEGGDFGILQMQNAAAGTGERLSGAAFVVYESNGTKRVELPIKEGAASLSLPVGNYCLKQLKASAGYGVEPARIAFAIAKGETTLVEVTSEIDLTNANPQDLIPKTGQAPPVLAYVLSMLCFIIASLCGFKLQSMDDRNQRKGGGLWLS